MKATIILSGILMLAAACSSGKAADKEGDASRAVATDTLPLPADTSSVSSDAGFEADSAYAFVDRLMAFGPRVPNTKAHRRSGDWLAGKMREFGWEVTEQTTVLKAFDGTALNVRNIFSQLNPEKGDRLLLLAHWDCRPWADQDPDPAKRRLPVPGANDGASGVGVLLEVARQLALQNSNAAVDILFVDAEDWGSEGDEDSWALGTRYFAENPPVAGYRPRQAILLDMVGSPDARFGVEYFSRESNPALLSKVWQIAESLGYDGYFHKGFGGAVTDDHVELIKHGIPAIDIIDYRYTGEYQGFDPVWHTTGDDMGNISAYTLGAVGETIMKVIKN